MMNEVLIHSLPNGLRVAARKAESNVSYIGILTNAGSRDDGAGRDGLAHFVEHTLFKGTPTKRSWIVNNRMELIGGELNAYTTKEEIMLYTTALAGFEERAIELLADLVANASFPAQELDLERNVVLEEIHSYHDNAAYAVFDEFDELFFAGSPLAHNILGYEESVRRLDHDDCRGFVEKWMAPENMVIYCVTPADPVKCIRLIERHLGTLQRAMPASDRNVPTPNAPFREIRNRDNHQANVLTGTRVFDARDPRRYALYLFSNILGGAAMNSRLNRELRDRRGLVYTVESSISLYSDTGLFQVYFGAEPAKCRKCLDIIRKEIERMASAPLSDRTFSQARQQLCGQLLVSGENRENNAMNLAKSLLRHGCVRDNNHTAEQIMKLTPADLLEMARFVADSPFSTLTLL